jgi:endonuclease/exonuclease/phosphatase family metal-dependent hydrolase
MRLPGFLLSRWTWLLASLVAAAACGDNRAASMTGDDPDAAVDAAPLIDGSPGGTRLRLVAGNITSGNQQSYDPGEGTRIFKGLHPDIAMVQELNYLPGNTPTEVRAWVDAAFGADFTFFREPVQSGGIPNGVVSRYPIKAAGIWEDPISPNREFVWTRIDIPGPKDLWAISVHLLTDDVKRPNQASALRDLINANVPAADYLAIGGDFNADTRTEAAVTTLGAVVSTAAPYPVDQAGVGETNAGRNKPYDWVMMDRDLRALQTPVVIGGNRFPAGLVFDSRVYTPLADVAPAMMTDSGAVNMQHMAVVVDVLLP